MLVTISTASLAGARLLLAGTGLVKGWGLGRRVVRAKAALSQKSTMCPLFVSLDGAVLQLGGMVMNSRASPEASWMPLSPSGMALGELHGVV